jgi:hypothetical protein
VGDSCKVTPVALFAGEGALEQEGIGVKVNFLPGKLAVTPILLLATVEETPYCTGGSTVYGVILKKVLDPLIPTEPDN